MAGRSLMLVYSKAVEGKEAEYHEWYDTVHIHDVSRIPGVVSAQRYLADGEEMYLAVYEVDGSTDLVMEQMRVRYGTEAMTASDALDLTTVKITAWSPR